MIARARGSNRFLRQVAVAACLLSFVTTGGLAYGQSKTYRPSPNYVQFGKPDQAEGRRIIEDFRQRGFPSDMFLQFELRVMPRRGEGKTVPARLWAGRNEKGPIWRLELNPDDAGGQRRLLVQNGPHSGLWSWQPEAIGAGKTANQLGLDALFERLADTDLTAFDLQMPFLFWDDFVFEGVAKTLGRPAHVFLLYPPTEIASRQPQLAGVRIYLDTQFNALVKTEQIGTSDRVLKTFALHGLKKIDEQYIPKEFDVVDETTRNATRFAVIRAALKLDLLPVIFEPSALSEPIQPPSANRLRNVDSR